MAGRSSIERDPALQAAVDALIQSGCTLDEIVEQVRASGGTVSRSAVGRYSKGYAAMAAEQRRMTTMADAFAQDFGDADNRQGRMLIQLLTSITTRAIMPMAEGEELDISGKELADLARAVKDITSASKTDIDREARAREEGAKRAREQAAAAGAEAARQSGATEQTINMVKQRILGIGA